MALVFATRPTRQRWSGEGKYKLITDVTLDALYVNGTGYTITNVQLGLPPKARIDFIDIQAPHSGYGFTAVIAADGQSITLRAWKTGAGLSGAFAEAATNEAGLNGLVVRLMATGN
jgi:hypothetical protein